MLKDKSVRDKITGKNSIEDLNSAQFVKAGAGAGKTTSIKERVLNLVTKRDLSPEKMVIITYTTKAANELVTRIRETFEANLELPNVEKALSKLTNAKISTFHSFCFDLLKEYPIEFCIDPELKLADEQSTEIMLDNCFRLMEEESYGSDTDESKLFLELLSEVKIEDLKKTFLAFYQNRDLAPIKINIDGLKDINLLKSDIEKASGLYYQNTLALLECEKDKTKPNKFIDHYNSNLESLFSSMSESEFISHVLEDNYELLKSPGAQSLFTSPDLFKELKAAAKVVKDSAEYMINAQKVIDYNRALEVYSYFEDTVESYKKLYGIIDFFDCLYLVKQKLDNSPHLQKLVQARFEVIIIDEFQDSDPMQASIAFHLAGVDTNKLFFVGDPKQSIYGFSRADISVYLETMDRIEAMDNGEVLELTTNFRSSGGLLDFINDNFSKILVRPEDRKSISVDYTDMYKSEDKADANFNTSNWEVDSTLSNEDKKPKVAVTRPREAFMVAKKICSMIESKKYSAGDFLVLFKTSTAMEEYEKQLRLLDIPVVNTKSKNFLKRAEVIELLNLLALCAFPKEKFYRTCIDHSELIQIDSESLEQVLALESDFESKFRICCNLVGFNALAIDSNEDQYLQFIENLCALANTELAANNYNLKATFNNLFEKAVNDSFFSGIKLNDESVHLQTRTANAVTLMTIHASKGLESRVVIMSSHDAGAFSATQYVDRKNQTILAETSFLSKKIAEGLDLTAVQDYYQLAENKRDEEDKRVLYVGVTRAEEEFVLITHADGKNKSFISMLLAQNPSFKETVSLNFEDYEKEFNRAQGHKAIKILSRTNSFSKKIITDLIDTQNISKSVTDLIDNPHLFKNIEGRKDGKEFGTFTHLVMEYVCNIIFNNKNCDIDTNKLIEKLYDGFGTKFEQKYMLELKEVVKSFLDSDLAKEIISAKAIHTELSFVSSDKYHGIIDLIIETDKELKIIDFKSDLLKSKKDEIIAHYKNQIGFYVKAVEREANNPVVGECIYLFGE